MFSFEDLYQVFQEWWPEYARTLNERVVGMAARTDTKEVDIRAAATAIFATREAMESFLATVKRREDDD